MTKRKGKQKTIPTSMRCVNCKTVQSVVLKNLHHEANLKCWKCGAKVQRNLGSVEVASECKTTQKIIAAGDIPACPYCFEKSKLVSGAAVYPGRSDLASLKYWLCKPCDAYVGCHKGTENPLGTLANASLRQARQSAHRSFDAHWKNGRLGRRDAYQWLSEQLGIPQEECHIGMFDLSQCRRVVAITKFEPECSKAVKRPKPEPKYTLEDYSPTAYQKKKLAENERRFEADKKAGKTPERGPEEVNVFDLSDDAEGF